MLFGIESDVGSVIMGYVVPDGVTGSSALSVRVDGTEVVSFTAADARPSLVIGGRHQTGACGFTLTEAQIPGLSNITHLEIAERDSGMLIYRRPMPHNISKKLLRLETHMFPLWRLDREIGQFFQHDAVNIDMFGRETTTQLFLIANTPSVYLSGRLLIQNYNYYIDGKFDVIAMLQDPYDEMAERLIVLSNMHNVRLPYLGEREYMSLGPIIEFVQAIRLDDEASLTAAFRDVDENIFNFFNDPLTRQLTANSPHEPPGPNKVAAALELLGSFAIVGQRTHADEFVAACAEYLGVTEQVLPSTPRFSGIAKLAEKLRANSFVGYMLERDRELFSHVAAAFANPQTPAD